MILICLISILLILLGIILTYFIKQYSHWRYANVPHIKPKFPFGNIKGVNNEIYEGILMEKYYKELKGKGPFGGLYFFHNPVALALDLDFIKKVFIKDFDHFHDRGVFYDEINDPLSANLFTLPGPKWHDLRSCLTQMFTPSKIRCMFPVMVSEANHLKQTLSNMIENDPVIEIKDLLIRFTTDIIGTCAFGIECNSLDDPNTEFRQMGKLSMIKTNGAGIKQFVANVYPTFAKHYWKNNFNNMKAYFLNITKQMVEYREKNNIKNNDFMDSLIKLKNSNTSKLGSLSLAEIAAEAYLLYIASFETSSTTMAFCLYELAVHKDIQTKVRNEIRNVLAKWDNKIEYDAMTELSYLNQVIMETLRKHPPGGNITRKVVKDYYVPEFNYTLKKGTSIYIPVHAIHHDPEYYPNPDIFNPDRFSATNVKERHNMTFLAFGVGYRNCIGQRFGLMQMHVALMTLLNTFEFSIAPEQSVPAELANKTFLLSTKKPLRLHLETLSN